MRNCCEGLNESSSPCSTRPGFERQVNGVEVGRISNVAMGVGVLEVLIGVGGFNVGSGGFDGVQAVIITRNAKNIGKSFVARRVFIPALYPLT